MQAKLTPQQMVEDARTRYDEIQISKAISWVMLTFDQFIFYTQGAHPEIAQLWMFNYIINPEDRATWAKRRPVGHRESASMPVEQFALMYIDAILAPQIVLSDPSLAEECANMRIAALVEDDRERGVGYAEPLIAFPDWRVEGCEKCRFPLVCVRPRCLDRQGYLIPEFKGDKSAVMECPDCGHVGEMGFELARAIPMPEP